MNLLGSINAMKKINTERTSKLKLSPRGKQVRQKKQNLSYGITELKKDNFEIQRYIKYDS